MRDPWTYKGQNGKLLIVAGSEKYTGSPILNGISALRTGIDLVTIAAPRRAADVAACYKPDLITVPLEGSLLLRKHVNQILELEKNNDALLLGGGLGREKETFSAVLEIIKRTKLPIAIDADAIRALEDNWSVLEGKKAVLLPHADEFRQLTGICVLPSAEDRKRKVTKAAKKLNCVILLTGHVDIISNGDKTKLNKTGSVFMTKGGFGDTLAGICAALLTKQEPFEAACKAAYVNGKAGEMLCKEKKQGVIASDIFDYISKIR